MRAGGKVQIREPRFAEAGTITLLIPRGRSGNLVEMTVDQDRTYTLDANLVYEHGLSVGVELDQEAMQVLFDADDLIAAKVVASHQLAYRARSVAEIRTVLQQRGFRSITIDAVVIRFTELGYLNDAEFADRWIANREALAPRGQRLLRQELKQKGVRQDLVDSSLERAQLDDFETALSLATHRHTKMQGEERDTQRRRLASFLERRGFSYEIVRRVDQTLFFGRNDDEA